MNEIAKYCIVSVIGTHAGESINKIFTRKIKEIKDTGFSFWLHKSYNAKPDLVNRMIRVNKDKPVKCYFITSSRGIKGARSTISADVAKEFSNNGKNWDRIPNKIKVTGKIQNAYALVFNSIMFPKSKKDIDLRYYNFFQKPLEPIKMRSGASTICAIKLQEQNKMGYIVSYKREIIAIGKLAKPYCVWLR